MILGGVFVSVGVCAQGKECKNSQAGIASRHSREEFIDKATGRYLALFLIGMTKYRGPLKRHAEASYEEVKNEGK